MHRPHRGAAHHVHGLPGHHPLRHDAPEQEGLRAGAHQPGALRGPHLGLQLGRPEADLRQRHHRQGPQAALRLRRLVAAAQRRLLRRVHRRQRVAAG